MGALLVPDALWEAIEPLLPKEPPKRKGGRPRVADRAALVLLAPAAASVNQTGKVAGCGHWRGDRGGVASAGRNGDEDGQDGRHKKTVARAQSATSTRRGPTQDTAAALAAGSI